MKMLLFKHLTFSCLSEFEIWLGKTFANAIYYAKFSKVSFAAVLYNMIEQYIGFELLYLAMTTAQMYQQLLQQLLTLFFIIIHCLLS